MPTFPRSAVVARHILSSLGNHLDSHYARGNLIYEADMEAMIWQFLQSRLPRRPGRYLVGCRHKLRSWLPDLTVYHLAGQEQLEHLLSGNWELYVVALIELKHRASIGEDLAKLGKMQRYLRRRTNTTPLCWMAYGDHFRRDVHQGNFNGQMSREAAIRNWTRKDPRTRGCTILKLGISKPKDGPNARATRRVLNEQFWTRDIASMQLRQIPHVPV